MPAGTPDLIVAVIHHPQPQPRLGGLTPVQVYLLKTGVDHRLHPADQRSPATGADLRIVSSALPRCQHLGPAHARRPRLFTGFPDWGRYRWRRCLRVYGLRLRRLRQRGIRLPLLPFIPDVRSPNRIGSLAPLPGCPTAWRPRTVRWPLMPPLPRLLESRQQWQRQPPQLLRPQGTDVVVIDLAQAGITQVHRLR